MQTRLLMLGSDGTYSRMAANALRRRFGNFPVVLETPLSRLELVRRRVSRLGCLTTAGQMLFVGAVYRPMRRSSRNRIHQIWQAYSLDESPLASDVRHVTSVNDDSTLRILEEVQPDVVAVMATRILSKRILSATPARFINLHGGITPAFRGCHGAYWALATGHPELAGVTIHLVDAGIDTGPVLKQARIPIGPSDNFATYSDLQIGVGVPLLVEAVDEALNGRPVPAPLEGADSVGSRLYHHPTLWGYLATRHRGAQ